tara:strand:- start:535 stop:747 length:213 start_codon:yes stop_codon:yes gene_type:complete
MLKLKSNSIKIITIKNKKFIPFQIHKLPKKYNEVSNSEQFNIKGLTYISLPALEEISAPKTIQNLLDTLK